MVVFIVNHGEHDPIPTVESGQYPPMFNYKTITAMKEMFKKAFHWYFKTASEMYEIPHEL